MRRRELLGRWDLPRYLWERTGSRTFHASRQFRLDSAAATRIGRWIGFCVEPRVTICIPITDRLDLLIPCLDSLALTSAGQAVDVIIGDTGSGRKTLAVCAELGLATVTLPQPFSFSKACNAMAQAAQGEILLFLNSDTTAISPDWVERICEIRDDEIIGATLVYPKTRRVQHAGVGVMRGAQWLQLSAYKPPRWHRANSELALWNIGLGKQLETLQRKEARVMAVTGAFLCTTRKQFESLGGFDEAFAVDLQDIDYCLRARAQGAEVICRRDIVFSHRHAASRGRYAFPMRDWQLLYGRWAEDLERWAYEPVPT